MIVDLLVCLDSTTSGAAALLAKAVARAAACRARLRVLDLCAPDALGMASDPRSSEFVEDARAAFRLSGIDGGHEMAPAHVAVLLEHILSADLLVVGCAASLGRSDLVPAIVGAVGPPVLIEADWDEGPAGQRILVPWTADRACTRAVHDALPLLEAADEVVLAAPDRDAPSALERRLVDRGVKARTEVVFVDPDAGPARLARGLGSDLIVLGLGGPARWPEPGMPRWIARLLDGPAPALLLSS